MKKGSDQNMTVLFYGIGGQGVLTASEICCLAASYHGYHVKKSEVKGMAQRGGSVESYVRFGIEVFSPLPMDGNCDVLVCLDESEYSRLKHQLRTDGSDLFSYLEVGAEEVRGHKLFLNTYMLGVLSSFLDIKEESWFLAMDQKFKRFQNENKEVFLKGRREGEKR